MWKLDKSTAEKTTKAAKCLLHSTSAPHVLADIRCIILRTQRKGCFFRTGKERHWFSSTNGNKAFRDSGPGRWWREWKSSGKKKKISNTFIHFGKLKDQWDETVKFVWSQLKRNKRKTTLLVKWRKTRALVYGQSVHLRVAIQMFCLEQNGTYGIKCLELFFVGLRCCERRVRPSVHRWAAGK